MKIAKALALFLSLNGVGSCSKSKSEPAEDEKTKGLNPAGTLVLDVGGKVNTPARAPLRLRGHQAPLTFETMTVYRTASLGTTYLHLIDDEDGAEEGPKDVSITLDADGSFSDSPPAEWFIFYEVRDASGTATGLRGFLPPMSIRETKTPKGKDAGLRIDEVTSFAAKAARYLLDKQNDATIGEDLRDLVYSNKVSYIALFQLGQKLKGIAESACRRPSGDAVSRCSTGILNYFTDAQLAPYFDKTLEKLISSYKEKADLSDSFNSDEEEFFDDSYLDDDYNYNEDFSAIYEDDSYAGDFFDELSGDLVAGDEEAAGTWYWEDRVSEADLLIEKLCKNAADTIRDCSVYTDLDAESLAAAAILQNLINAMSLSELVDAVSGKANPLSVTSFLKILSGAADSAALQKALVTYIQGLSSAGKEDIASDLYDLIDSDSSATTDSILGCLNSQKLVNYDGSCTAAP